MAVFQLAWAQYELLSNLVGERFAELLAHLTFIFFPGSGSSAINRLIVNLDGGGAFPPAASLIRHIGR